MSDFRSAGADAEPSAPPPNANMGRKRAGSAAKIYERPERKGLSPILLVILLIILAVLAFGAYRLLIHRGPAGERSSNGALHSRYDRPGQFAS